MTAFLNKIKRIIQSIFCLGFASTLRIVCFKIKAERFKRRMRKSRQAGEAYISRFFLSKRCCKEWQSYKKGLADQELSYITKMFSTIVQTKLLEQADAYARNEFQVLGSQPYKLDDVMWHTDIRLKQQGGVDYQFPGTTFYADITIKVGEGQVLEKDIKVPWELSRLQHLPMLSYAYRSANDIQYKDAFVYHVQHWIDHNPYLQGVNWVCPMEVALRSISLIIAWHYFKHADIPDNFWQMYVALLYDHMMYLEHNWEWYDGRTSNHYLSNIVGYLYLCWFFKPLCNMSKKINWVINEIIAEMDKQVFDEGTSYEGSTKYHIFVTELFYHAQQLCTIMNIVLPKRFHEKLDRMIEFGCWCSINEDDYITIGDDDSGKVTFVGLPLGSIPVFSTTVKHYSNFGVSFFKDIRWHISLRHHAYNAKQPSGHYHNDIGSITLAFNGIPIIIDPGSYVYTPSRHWRNYFRSVQMHSGMHVMLKEQVLFDSRLFALALPENRIILHQDEQKILNTSHKLYDRYKLKYDREIICANNAVEIIDNCLSFDSIDEDLLVCNTIIFDDNVALSQDQNSWLIYYNNEPLLILRSSFDFLVYDEYKAVSYGQLVSVKRLSTTFGMKQSRVRCKITLSMI